MTPQNAPEDVIKIFNRQGIELVQFRANVSRSWVIGKEGRATMTLATRKTEYVNDDVLQSGNWLLVQNDVLPDWIGVIDFPREWSMRTVTINAFSPERVFSWRRGQLEEKLSGSAGAIFEQLLIRVNRAEPTILRAGDIWRGGAQRDETLHPNPLSQNLTNIQTRSREEYIWRASNAGGSLVVFADWVQSLGGYTHCPLIEGKRGGNIEGGGVMVEDGIVVNDVLGFGKGTTWNTKPNDTTYATDTSRTMYGLRQYGKDWGNIIQKATVTENNTVFLRNNSQPRRNFSVTALNRGETFQYMDLGNRFLLQMQSVGFQPNNIGVETNVRILGMSYDPLQGHKVQLVLQELR